MGSCNWQCGIILHAVISFDPVDLFTPVPFVSKKNTYSFFAFFTYYVCMSVRNVGNSE
jgi:hypothetical protein